MTWNRRYQVKSYIRSGLWIIPFVALLFEQVVGDAREHTRHPGQTMYSWPCQKDMKCSELHLVRKKSPQIIWKVTPETLGMSNYCPS